MVPPKPRILASPSAPPPALHAHLWWNKAKSRSTCNFPLLRYVWSLQNWVVLHFPLGRDRKSANRPWCHSVSQHRILPSRIYDFVCPLQKSCKSVKTGNVHQFMFSSLWVVRAGFDGGFCSKFSACKWSNFNNPEGSRTLATEQIWHGQRQYKLLHCPTHDLEGPLLELRR